MLDKKEYKDIKSLDKMDSKLTKELISVYWPKLTNAYAQLLKDTPKEEFPHNLEEFDQFVREKYAEKYTAERKGDALADGEDGSDGKPLVDGKDVAHEVKKNAYNAESIWSIASAWSTESKWNNFEAWNMVVDKAKLKEVIDTLPEWSKVREMLQAWYNLIWINEKDKRIKDFLNQHGQKIDPAKTPWCRAFVNAELAVMWVKTNGSLSARDAAKSIWKSVDSKDLLPWDIVVVERHWKASDGSPGGHIGIFLWMSPSWHPIMLGWNQHNSVTIKEEKRNVIWFRRAMSDAAAEKIKISTKGGSNESKS